MADKPERNDPCPCGSERKYKNCCINKDDTPIKSTMGMVGIVIAILIGFLALGMALSGGDSSQNCPTGQTWSETHQHCH